MFLSAASVNANLKGRIGSLLPR